MPIALNPKQMRWQVVRKQVGQAKPYKGHRYTQADTDTDTQTHRHTNINGR